MANAIDFAKFFLKQGLDTNRNSHDGSMKLQKLLFFANLISLSETGKPLFPERIVTSTNGCVVESVKLRCENDYVEFCHDSEVFEPDFTQQEYDIVNLTVDIFGKLTTQELSELNYSFSFWKKAYESSDNTSAIIQNSDMLKEIQRIKLVIEQYKTNRMAQSASKVINNVTFLHSPDLELTNEILAKLEQFSRTADENIYSIYLENGNLVTI